MRVFLSREAEGPARRSLGNQVSRVVEQSDYRKIKLPRLTQVPIPAEPQWVLEDENVVQQRAFSEFPLERRF